MSIYLRVEGQQWQVTRIHQMAQLQRAGSERERELYLVFSGPDAEVRRSQIPETFPAEPTPAQLESVWRHAEVVRAPIVTEMHSKGGLTMPPVSRILVLCGRALRLRCPACGKGRVLKSWFALKEHCPNCHIRLERGEESDYYLGGMMFNIILAEAIFVVLFLAALLIMWPNVPWEGLEYSLVGAMIVAPIVLYPISRVIWLAFDLLFRPASSEELAWHAASADVSPPNRNR